MNKEDWKKIEEIISEALTLEGSQRRDFLAIQTEKFPKLAAEVNSLINNEDKADRFFDSLENFKYEEFFDEDLNEANVGQTIGNYRILNELGTGGMGAVFLAQRTDGEFKQKVAIKMLRREFNTSKIRHRFEKEKEIQSKLIHPNIARLIDAGTTDDKIPYLVMEFIEGRNIFEYCQSENLSLEARLKLFNKVCEAVSFAHRNLIIHRDLKPSNIIVMKDGEPKLLDFGISKLINDDIEQTQTVTKLGAMTPEYASPEQIRRESVTTATDIYSLGVILFELLSGHRPFEKEFKESGDVFKAIIESEPEAPSDILQRFQTAGIPNIDAKKSQKNRHRTRKEAETQVLEEAKTLELINETKLQFSAISPRELRGDLDNIVLKTLRKEPDRRYQTVERFSADIWRHLDGLPVSARPATFNYRASKFIKRNKISVVASGMILIAILGGLFTTLWQARRASVERAKAERRFNDVRTLANSILFDVYPTVEKLEGSIDARKQIVENAIQYLDSLSKEASDNTELQLELAEAYEKIGDVQGNNKYPNLGDMKGSLSSYAKAKSLFQKVFEEDRSNLALKDNFAEILEKEGFVAWWSGDNPKTYERYNEALALREELVKEKPDSGDFKLSLASLYLDYGDVPYWENKNEEADKHYKLAFGVLEKLAKDNEQNKDIQAKYAHSYNRLSKVNVRLAEYNTAIKNLETAREIYQTLATKNPDEQKLQMFLWATQFGICEVYLFEENGEKAIRYCPKILDIQKSFVENEPNNSKARYNLANSYYYISEAYLLGNKFENGRDASDKGVEVIESLITKNPKNPDYKHLKLSFVKTKAKIFAKSGDVKNAQKSFEKHISGYEKFLRENPKNSRAKVNLFKSYTNIAEISSKRDSTQWFEKSYKFGQELLKDKALNEADKKILEKVKKALSKSG